MSFTTTCEEPVAPVSISGTTTVCPNTDADITRLGGDLNDAEEWRWYTGSCGGTYIDAGTTITVNPAITTTYYVRAEGACVISTDCASATMTVIDDNEAPEITCPSSRDLNIDAGNCTAAVHDIAPSGISDNCGTLAVTYTLSGATIGGGNDDASGTNFETGPTTVTYIVNDGNGNTGECAFTVTVTDNVLPTINCPGNVSQLNDAGICSAVVNSINPTGVGDNCGTPAVTYTLTGATIGNGENDAGGNAFNAGETFVEYTVNDGNGNSENCSFTVTVEDNENPVARTHDITVELNENGTITITPEQINNASTDNCSIANMSLDITDFNCGFIGANTISLTITDDAGNTDTETATVTLEDNLAPVFNTYPDIIRCVDEDLLTVVVDYQDPTAEDNCSSEVQINRISGSASGSVFPLGTSPISCEATDEYGNRAEFTFNINVLTRSVELNAAESPETPYCSGTQDQVTLTYSGGILGEGAFAYWYSDATLSDEVGIGNNLVINAPDITTTYYIQIKGTCNETGALPLEIVVYPLPVLDITPDFEIDYGEEIQLDATYDEDYIYLWHPADQLDNPDLHNPIFTAENSASFLLTVTDENYCQSRANVNIDVILRTELLIYNAITPNGDGKNDTWFIRGLTPLQYKIEVRNRAGIIVFKSSDYNNEWDGTDQNGDQLQGPHFYIIKVYDNAILYMQVKKKYTGIISILR